MTMLGISNSNEQVISYEMEERGSFMDPWPWVFWMYWILCAPHQHYSRVWYTLHWRNLTSWLFKYSLPIKPMLYP
jgi:hypothetical protein